MNLPNYFLADLPADTAFSPTMLREACLTLKRNRAQFMASRGTQGLIGLLSHLGKSWLDPNFPFRQQALEKSLASTGFHPETLRTGLDHFFGQLTQENLEALLAQDLGDPGRLEALTRSPVEVNTGRAAFGRGPELLANFAAGNIPVAALSVIVFGVLLRSAQFVKCASGGAFLPRLFAHSIYEADPKLGACIELAAWPGGKLELEGALFETADCVVASGTDETLEAIRTRVPSRARFVGYGHRVSFGFVASDVLSGLTLKQAVQDVCEDVVAWNQLGCLSPHLIYVQDGGVVGPEKFAGLVAEALAAREQTEPRGKLPTEQAAVIASRRALYEVRAAHTAGTRLWQSKDSTAWTVVYEAEAYFQSSCLNRLVYVKGVKDLTEALQAADKVRGKVSTVGIASTRANSQKLALELAHWGVPRVCPLGRMQKPPLCWRHDGRPALGDLVTWTDYEMPS